MTKKKDKIFPPTRGAKGEFCSSTHEHLPSRPGGGELQPELGDVEEEANGPSRSVGLVLVRVSQPVRDPADTPHQTHRRARNLYMPPKKKFFFQLLFFFFFGGEEVVGRERERKGGKTYGVAEAGKKQWCCESRLVFEEIGVLF